MRYLLIALLFILDGCQKDGVFPHPPPAVSLDVQWVTTQAYFLKGNVTSSAECWRGFIVSRQPGATLQSGATIYVFDRGTGEYNMIVACEASTTYYIRAWDYRTEENVGYSEEKSFKTW
jgi:hypothetical protein